MLVFNSTLEQLIVQEAFRLFIHHESFMYKSYFFLMHFLSAKNLLLTWEVPTLDIQFCVYVIRHDLKVLYHCHVCNC
jgi:hypothetical protein